MLLVYKKSKVVPVIDHTATGKAAAKARNKAKVSQSDLADQMDVQGSFLSALEHGTRSWSPRWEKRFESALKRLTKA